MPVLYWFSRRMTLWGTISFNLAVFVNLIIAFFYPYNSGQGTSVVYITGIHTSCLQIGHLTHPLVCVGVLSSSDMSLQLRARSRKCA